MVRPSYVVQLANLARRYAQVRVGESELPDDEKRSDLDWLSNWLHGDIDALQGTFPGRLHIRVNWGPELMALWPAFLRNVARCDDKRDVLLCNHAPKVLECVVKGPLRSYNLPITDLSERTIYEIGIDVAVHDRVSCLHAVTGHKNRPRVLVRLDVDISVLFTQFFGFFHAHISLSFGICALIERIKLVRELLLCFPFRDSKWLFEVSATLSFDFFPYVI